MAIRTQVLSNSKRLCNRNTSSKRNSKMKKPLYGKYIVSIEYFHVPIPLKANFGKQFMTNKLLKLLKQQNKWDIQ